MRNSARRHGGSYIVKDLILAFDLGTGGAKATLFDALGNALADDFVSYQTSYPGAGLHEQRPEDWWDAVTQSARSLFAERRADVARVACIDQTPIWSDTRTGEQTKAFFSKVDSDDWYLTTGNGFPAECYALFKAMWYRDNEPEMFDKVHWLLGSKDYINLRLTGVAGTDHSYASGSGGYDLTAGHYSDGYFDAAGIDRGVFPEPVASTEVVGELTAEAGGDLGVAAGTPVVAGGVDNSCMALGARNVREGRVYTSIGSSAWIAVSSRRPVVDAEARPFVFAHVVPDMFTSAVSIFAAGSSLKWVREVLFTAGTGESASYRKMDEWASRSPVGSNGLLFNPSLAGGTSQEPSARMRGGFFGLDLRHDKGDVVRAVLEGVALNLGAVLDLLRGFVKLEDEMLLVGGGAQSAVWRQIFADVYGMRTLKTNVDQDAGSLGAAALGAVGVGLWDGFERIDEVHHVEATADPDEQSVAGYSRIRPLFEMTRQDAAALGDAMASVVDQK
jgi:xylulokinase